ncbi:MAG: hypothetical protein KF858_10540 [Candidatus Sumerlaeia bacterium]|nr:hypothetical protein [Candidatus Sumerlaeia bacterium]
MGDKPSKNPFKLVKGMISGVRQWVDDAERENMEHRMELVRAKAPNPMDPVVMDPTAPPPSQPKSPKPTAPAGKAPWTSRPPTPGDPHAPLAPRNLAGMRLSSETPKQKFETPNEGVRISNRENTSYHERNRTVALIKEHYAAYGHSISSAMLTKCLMPRGIPMLLERMELTSCGSEEGDHEQIRQWVDAKGLEAFCQALGVRFQAAKINEEQRNHQMREQKRREAVEDSRKTGTRPGVKPTRVQKMSRPSTDRVASPFVKQTNIQPIALPPEEPAD